ncbi:Hypothetical protein CINCED_3A018379, partial [Cinara cedri]
KNLHKYESSNDFVELLPFVVKTLEAIYSTWGVPSSIDANVLLKSVLDSEFLVSLYDTKIFFAFGMPVCKQLQKERTDLKNNLSTIELLVNTLKEMRQDAEKEFHILTFHTFFN